MYSAVLCLLISVAAVISGCDSSAPATNADASSTTPAAIAVAYANDLFSNRVSQATAMVSPDSQSDFRTVASIISQRPVSAHGLTAGTTKITGNTAVVVLVGTICRGGTQAGSGTTPPSTSANCLSNSDPNLGNRGFMVSLKKATNGKWYVYFPA